MKTPLYIIGAGGHATSVAEIAFATKLNLKAFISNNSAARKLHGLPVMSEIPQQSESAPIAIAIAIGDNYWRESAFVELNKRYPIEVFPPMIHPSASVSLSAKVGFGTTIHQNAVVGGNVSIGLFCTLNSSSTVEHDCHLENFSSVGPGAALGGNVSLGYRSVVAIGATVRHGLTIGADSILGAASYAHTSTEPNTISIGSPASSIAYRHAGDRYL